MLIDDFSNPDLIASIGTVWRGVSDRVMGGISEATIEHRVIDCRSCLRLTGDVRLENNGGFVQAALDLDPDGGALDASGFTGLRLMVRGNGETYGFHLRTADALRPWQSYRASLIADQRWTSIHLPFAAFQPYRLSTALDVRRLRRVGLVAIGRAFAAELMVCDLRFYR